MDLSVVIAATDAGRSIRECLRRFQVACAGLQAELLVVEGSRDDTPLQVARCEGVRLLRMPPDTLTPRLWAEGYRQSSGRVVAFTTGHCLARPGWGAAMMAALDAGASGAGGPLTLASEAGPLDWAIFFLRYSRFTPDQIGSGRISGEIAGDNAAYRRDALDRHAATFSDGFWEIDFHRLVRADGGWLAAVPAAAVEFGRSFRLGTILRHRYAHGRQLAVSRIRGGTRRPWQIVLAAPLVPFLLAARAASRILPAAGNRARFVGALPWFLLLASSWALGEAVGGVTREDR